MKGTIMSNEVSSATIPIRTVAELERALGQLWQTVETKPAQFANTSFLQDVRFGLDRGGRLVFKISTHAATQLALKGLPAELRFLLAQSELRKWFVSSIEASNDAPGLHHQGNSFMSVLRPTLPHADPDSELCIWDPFERVPRPVGSAKLIADYGLTLVVPEDVKDSIVSAVPRRFNEQLARFK
jgi:hypothetical protein